MLQYFLTALLALIGIFMIIVVLLQRGRGGGLAGALGGAGGQSAFGTKAGDVFTRVTVVIAVIWVLLAGICILVLRSGTSKFGGGSAVIAQEPTVTDAAGTSADESMPADEAPFESSLSTTSDSAIETKPAESPEEKPASDDKPATDESSADEKGTDAAPGAEGKKPNAEPSATDTKSEGQADEKKPD